MIEMHGQKFNLIQGRQYLQGIITGKIKEEHQEHIKKVFDDYGVIISDEMKTLVTTGMRSGRKYIYRGVSYVASAPGEPPAKRSGQLAEGFGFAASFIDLRIWNDAKTQDGKPYPLYLSEGTRKMNARPYFLIIIAKYDSHIKTDLEGYKGD